MSLLPKTSHLMSLMSTITKLVVLDQDLHHHIMVVQTTIIQETTITLQHNSAHKWNTSLLVTSKTRIPHLLHHKWLSLDLA